MCIHYEDKRRRIVIDSILDGPAEFFLFFMII